MIEIEYRVSRAKYYRECLSGEEINDAVAWCLFVGLWETSGWICNGDTISPPILDWLEPGQRDG